MSEGKRLGYIYYPVNVKVKDDTVDTNDKAPTTSIMFPAWMDVEGNKILEIPNMCDLLKLKPDVDKRRWYEDAKKIGEGEVTYAEGADEALRFIKRFYFDDEFRDGFLQFLKGKEHYPFSKLEIEDGPSAFIALVTMLTGYEMTLLLEEYENFYENSEESEDDA